jgi:hypothetical protein
VAGVEVFEGFFGARERRVAVEEDAVDAIMAARLVIRNVAAGIKGEDSKTKA